jgi:hypothetical protein
MEQSSIRVVCPDGSRNAALSTEAAQLVDRRYAEVSNSEYTNVVKG